MMGWETTVHPFLGHPEYVKLMRLPIGERLAELRRPEVKARLVGDAEAIPTREQGGRLTFLVCPDPVTSILLH